MQIPRGQVTEPSPNPVAHHRGTHRAAHDEADSGGLTAVPPDQQVADQQRAPSATATADCDGKLRPAAHPDRWRQHQPSPPRGRGGAGQTLTRGRPLRRRAERTARPARVRMRSRKPCVFARRRLFGWNVRLLTGTPDAGKVFGPPPTGVLAQRSAPPEWPDLRTLRGLAATVKPVRPVAGRHSPFAERAHGSAPRLWTVRPVCAPAVCTERHQQRRALHSITRGVAHAVEKPVEHDVGDAR